MVDENPTDEWLWDPGIQVQNPLEAHVAGPRDSVLTYIVLHNLLRSQAVRTADGQGPGWMVVKVVMGMTGILQDRPRRRGSTSSTSEMKQLCHGRMDDYDSYVIVGIVGIELPNNQPFLRATLGY